MKVLRIVLVVLVVAFAAIQFIPVDRPENLPYTSYDFFTANEVPEEVEGLIRTACYDCHSQEVIYPWYSYVAPVSWLIAKDVRQGRDNLDFSHWHKLDKREKLNVLDDIADEVEEKEMPLKVYVRMHSDADLSDKERLLIIQWANEMAERVFEE